MPPSPALTLIRPRQLLSALFTVHFHAYALQILIPKIGHSAKTQVQLPTIFQLFLPQRRIPSIALICLDGDKAVKRAKNLKPLTHRLQIFLVKYEYLPSLQSCEYQGIPGKLKKRVCHHVLAVLTTYMETKLDRNIY